METDKINKILERCYTTYGPEIRIKYLLYVDEIIDVGNSMVMENTVKIKAIRRKKKVYFQQYRRPISKSRKQR